MPSPQSATESVRTNRPIDRVVIVGGGTAGWMCAAALVKALPSATRITLVESEEIGTVGVGEATIPTIRTFNDLLGLDEFDFVRQTQATYKLGIEFVGWDRPTHRYFHPFGAHGRDTPEFRFLQLWLRLKHGYLSGECADPGPIGDYNLNTLAAQRNRFQRPGANAGDVTGSIRYAFHFDASLYAGYLRGFSEARGVARIEGRITGVNLRPEDGFIESVTLGDGRIVGGDLFVDCSGFRGLLVADALKTGFESWSEFLPCDRALAVPSEAVSEPIPYTRATADSAGWRWRIPLQHRTGNGYVYSSAHLSDDQAADRLLSQLDGKPLADPRPIRFTAGRRERLWVRNCVAMGLAGGFIEPLESTSIHLIQTGIAKLVSFFPDKSFDQADIDEFNRATAREYEAIRDFIILHYCATERADTAFWRERRGMRIPDSLAHRMDLFRSKGRVFRFQDELFAEDSWLAVMLGQGLMPRGYDPLVDKLPLPEIARNVGLLRQLTAKAAEAMPRHGDFISRYGAAPALGASHD